MVVDNKGLPQPGIAPIPSPNTVAVLEYMLLIGYFI